jgi:phosphoribosylaminoimidazole carboxylase (NCAIR synthetase)
MANLMMLGASYLQRPFVERAIALGHRVITVDNVPGNVCHRISHRCYDISTVDGERVLKAAVDERIDGILTACSDVAVAAVGRVNDALGLAGVTAEQARVLCTKHNFRQFQADHGLPHPDFYTSRETEPLLRAAPELGHHVMVKAVDRSGSRGVRKVASDDATALTQAIEESRRVGLSGVVCIESVLSGTEYGGDALVVDGAVRHLFVTDKHLAGTVVRGHSMPTRLAVDQLERVRLALEAHVRCCGYRNGPLNFDVMVDDSGAVWVIEMSPRAGGNWIPQLVEFTFGADLFTATIDAALGRQVSIRVYPDVRPAGVCVFGAPYPGRLLSAPAAAALCSGIPGVVSADLNVALGAEVMPMRDSGDQIGRVMFELETPSLYWSTAARIEAAIWARLEVQPVALD